MKKVYNIELSSIEKTNNHELFYIYRVFKKKGKAYNFFKTLCTFNTGDLTTATLSIAYLNKDNSVKKEIEIIKYDLKGENYSVKDIKKDLKKLSYITTK